MNERPKTILHTAWNEPRHFFFWLAMLSLLGFAVVAVGTVLIGPKLVLAFAALGCALGFVVGVPGFILAWIPPVRRGFSWLLGRRFLALGCLVTLVALCYAIENWRGRRAWQDFKREREAKGERFDWASFAPPAVPKEQNFFETPLWTDLHFVETNRGVVWGETDEHKRVVFDAYGPRAGKAPRRGDWMKAERTDLAAWQAFYRGSNSVSALDEAARGIPLLDAPVPAPAPEESVPTTNYFPVAKEPQTPAADVLLALSKFETNRQLLIETAARPQARFWANYDAGFGTLLPHLARVKASVQYLSLHAEAALKAGDRATALEDVNLMFRLMEAIRSEPTLISQLVRMAVLQIALGPVWEGLADRQWTEGDLKVMEGRLSQVDFLADYQFAMRGERACSLWWVDYIRKVGAQGLNELAFDTGREPPGDWERSLGQALFQLVPAGWYDQNRLNLCRFYERYLLTLVTPQERRMLPPTTLQRADAVLEQEARGPFNVLTRLLLPAMGRAAGKCARAQTSADLALVACALERYRLANGQFPESLQALTPKYIEKLPHDIVNGEPLKYRRTEGGQFVLYSVGWNETDEGGKVELTKSGVNVDWQKGDWVWRYSAK